MAGSKQAGSGTGGTAAEVGGLNTTRRDVIFVTGYMTAFAATFLFADLCGLWSQTAPRAAGAFCFLSAAS